MKTLDTFFLNRSAVIVTRHGKERVIAPLLAQEFGMQVDVCDSIDTDRFGTFTRDVRRQKNQLETARAKADAGLKVSQADFAIASEGAFWAHPDVPFATCNTEIVLLRSRDGSMEIVGTHQSMQAHMHQGWADSAESLQQIAKEQDFPRHGMVLRRNPHSVRSMRKNIHSLQDLHAETNALLRWPWQKRVFYETDLRAHRNPTRMAAIAEATKDLAQRMKQQCPACALPGFGIVDYRYGLPCRQCGAPTRSIRASILRCSGCAYTVERIAAEERADPAGCQHCNP